MDKPSALAVKEGALSAVGSLLRLLEVAKEGYDADEYAQLHRAVGVLVGEIQVRVLDPVYEAHPALSDLQ